MSPPNPDQLTAPLNPVQFAPAHVVPSARLTQALALGRRNGLDDTLQMLGGPRR